MWRQGDVLIERIASIPRDLPRLKRLVLASGDSTAQRHEIKERGVAKLFGDPKSALYFHVTASQATIVHPEHGPITLPEGTYRVWRQREFVAPEIAPRTVVD
ncbi:MAG TPA: hypothetical protein VHM90_12650 [Phycisphaerae bacterium]|jgi:hypothetical protein|nr:hypothetical protein [Phycisphaerae bacterium]